MLSIIYNTTRERWRRLLLALVPLQTLLLLPLAPMTTTTTTTKINDDDDGGGAGDNVVSYLILGDGDFSFSYDMASVGRQSTRNHAHNVRALTRTSVDALPITECL